MDQELLKTFLEVNRTRHFGKAAENLFVSQSTVSNRIRLLEETLGVALFSRSRNDIRLTPAGKKLLEPAQRILDTWNRARQQISVEYDGKIPITVAALPSLWDIMLSDWVGAVYEHLENVTLNLEVHSFEPLRRGLQERSVDLAFMFEPPQMAGFDVAEVAHIPLCLVSSNGGQDVEEAIRQNYVLVDWGTSFGISHARLLPEAAPMMRAGLGRIALDFLLDQGGSAYLATQMAQRYIDTGALHPVIGAPVIDRVAYAVFPSDTDKRAILDAGLRLLSEAGPIPRGTAPAQYL